MGKIKYDKGNLDSAIIAAKKIVSNSDRAIYVHATYFGFTVTKIKPPFNQKYYKIENNRISKSWTQN